jgi:SAM-dependent methyltransferase
LNRQQPDDVGSVADDIADRRWDNTVAVFGGARFGHGAAMVQSYQEGDADLSALYRARFDTVDLKFKQALWRILCEDFFQRYVRSTDTVLDLGAGTCEFLRAIKCEAKIAVDLNPDVVAYAEDAKVLVEAGSNMASLADDSVDVVFSSNFFEHLPGKSDVLDTLRECRRILRPGGRLLILNPNIRYLAGRYWDYFDHHTPLTHLSMVEALTLAGFSPTEVIPRFLPYTVKDRRVPRSRTLVRLYLRLRPLWPLFGRQMFIVAEA